MHKIWPIDYYRSMCKLLNYKLYEIIYYIT